MAVKTMAGYASHLTKLLEATDRQLPVADEQTLLNRLSEDGDWTSLLIQDTVGYEVVKVLNHHGNIVIDRGLSGTTPKRFPVGSCVVFAPSDELHKSLACDTDCCENGVDDTFGDEAEHIVNVPVEKLPNQIMGGVGAVLGEPDGFMLINGKRVPYYD